MGLLPRTAKVSGSVRFRGQELLGVSDGQLNKVRGKSVSMIFQDPMTSLNPVYSIGYQVAEAVLAHQDVSRAQAQERALELLEIVRIPNPRQRLDNYPHELSGGMRQRVVIAIAMANNPDVIIADEPTTALDVTVQAQIMDALRLAQEETGAAMVLITHDLGVIAGQRSCTRASWWRSAPPRTSSTPRGCPTRSACWAACPGWTGPASGSPRSAARRRRW
jgi:peptide/nickel transport system ATP-binding protein